MNKRIKVIICVLTLISFTGVLLVIRDLPDIIPTHFGFDGEADGYGNKYTYLLISLLPLLMIVMADVLPKIDPKKDNYKYHSKAYGITIGFATALFIVIPWAAVLKVKGLDFNIGLAVDLLIGILIVVLGNYMPTFKQNYFCGIKTPWTLANEEVWKKTHRVGGYVFIFSGFVMIFAGLSANQYGMIISIALLLIGTLYLYIYSYLCFKKINKD